MSEITVEIAAPDDWHVHLRDDEMLAAVAPYTANAFRHAVVMPNLVPPVTSTAAAAAYRDRILAAAGPDARPDFTPVMVLYLNDQLDAADLLAGAADGIVFGAKYYPAGATTNSAAGGSSLLGYRDVLEAMAGAGVPLLVHAESTDPAVDIFDREAHFLETQLAAVCERVPSLLVTVEHVSTSAGVDFVASHAGCAATVTPHHISRDRTDLLADGMKPDLYCKPVINSIEDRERLVDVVTSGAPAFMLGTDSAPHPTTAKYGPTAKAGVFNAAYGLEVVAEVFFRAGKLDNLAAFVSGNGVARWGVEAPSDTLTLERSEVDRELATTFSTTAGDEVVLFGVEEAAKWSIR